MTYDRVYRLNEFPALKGRLCRIVDRPPPERDHKGAIIYNTGTELVAVEFADGATHALRRDSVILADTPMGRRVIAMVARGGTLLRDHRSKQAKARMEA